MPEKVVSRWRGRPEKDVAPKKGVVANVPRFGIAEHTRRNGETREQHGCRRAAGRVPGERRVDA